MRAISVGTWLSQRSTHYAAVVAAATFLIGSAAAAHDFWLQPARWQVEPGEIAHIRFEVGHGADRQRTQIPSSRIVRFEAVNEEGERTDFRSRLDIGGADADAAVGFAKSGTYVMLLETDNAAQSLLPAQQFNDYLEHEGLTPAIEARRLSGAIARDGSENYSRHAKTIIQVGATGPGVPRPIVRPLGLELEIVPDRNPLALPPDRRLPVRIFYRGKPLAGALVKLNNLGHDAQPVAMLKTDSRGRATFSIPGPGHWQMNVIWTTVQGRSSLNDFNTSFSSLSFEMRK